MTKAMIHMPLLGSPGLGPMYRLNPPLIGPVLINTLKYQFLIIQGQYILG